MTNQMTAADYAENFSMTHEFDAYVQDAFWQENFSTEKCYEWMLGEAQKAGITLTGVDEFEYDRYFHNAYRCTEKGLS